MYECSALGAGFLGDSGRTRAGQVLSCKLIRAPHKMAELEGFLCPLCREDCLSVRELETHYREKHEESVASKFKSDFRSLIDKAKNTFRIEKQEQAGYVRSESSEPEAISDSYGPVTNVSGIATEEWNPQEMGKS